MAFGNYAIKCRIKPDRSHDTLAKLNLMALASAAFLPLTAASPCAFSPRIHLFSCFVPSTTLIGKYTASLVLPCMLTSTSLQTPTFSNDRHIYIRQKTHEKSLAASMSAPTQELPSWLTLLTTTITDSSGVPLTTSTTLVFLPLTYYGPSVGSLHSNLTALTNRLVDSTGTRLDIWWSDLARAK